MLRKYFRQGRQELPQEHDDSSSATKSTSLELSERGQATLGDDGSTSGNSSLLATSSNPLFGAIAKDVATSEEDEDRTAKEQAKQAKQAKKPKSKTSGK